MSNQTSSESSAQEVKFKFPSAYTILFILIALVAALTWVIPAGKYDRAMNELLGKEVPVAGSYKEVEGDPQSLIDVLLAPIDGFYDHISYTANAIDVSLFVLMIGGFLGLINKTGAIDAGIERVTEKLHGREELMIPILMALFAAGGTVYGMAEESLPFYGLLVPIMLAARFDALVAVATVLVGSGIGVLASTINPFATVIASNAAGIAFTDGIVLRLIMLVIGWIICVLYVMRYARIVREDPSKSYVFDKLEEHKAFFLGEKRSEKLVFTAQRKVILVIFVGSFAAMIYGVSVLGWWMAEISAIFIAASILVGLVARMSEEDFVNNFVDGSRDLLGVALVIGLARGIVVIMDRGMITDTLLFHTEAMITGLSSLMFINAMFFVEVLLSFLVPSTSGLAVLTMPIMAPLADFAGVARELVITAYQTASGLVNLITPTSGVIMGGLAIARVPYVTWIKWVMPLIVVLALLSILALSVATMI